MLRSPLHRVSDSPSRHSREHRLLAHGQPSRQERCFVSQVETERISDWPRWTTEQGDVRLSIAQDQSPSDLGVGSP